jgi:hypothetical protein
MVAENCKVVKQQCECAMCSLVAVHAITSKALQITLQKSSAVLGYVAASLANLSDPLVHGLDLSKQQHAVLLP